MKQRSSIPTALQIIAILFLLDGIGSAVGIAISLASHSVHIDLGVLGIPAFFGLRRFSTGWRTYALVCIWLGLIGCPFIAAFTLFNISSTGYLQIFGIRLTQVPSTLIALACVPVFLLAFWQYRTLTRADIRALFYSPNNERNA